MAFKPLRSLCAAFALAAGVFSPDAQSAELIVNFNDLNFNNAGINSVGSTYASEGFLFDPHLSNSLRALGNTHSRYVGSGALYLNQPGQTTVTYNNGRTFDLTSTNLAELTAGVSTNVTLTGLTAYGETVTQTLTLAGNNPVTSQNFMINPSFKNLVSLTLDQTLPGGHQMDAFNFDVDAPTLTFNSLAVNTILGSSYTDGYLNLSTTAAGGLKTIAGTDGTTALTLADGAGTIQITRPDSGYFTLGDLDFFGIGNSELKITGHTNDGRLLDWTLLLNDGQDRSVFAPAAFDTPDWQLFSRLDISTLSGQIGIDNITSIVPEPSRAMLVLVGALALLSQRRRPEGSAPSAPAP